MKLWQLAAIVVACLGFAWAIVAELALDQGRPADLEHTIEQVRAEFEQTRVAEHFRAWRPKE